MKQKIVAGIDGGGTKTRAALLADSGELLGVASAGPSNYDDIGEEIAKRNIDNAFREAWRQTGEPSRSCDAVFLGMAGVVSETDRATIRQIACDLKLAPPKHVGVDHDIRISLAGSLAGQEGIALIVGTGSSCYGRRTDGRDWRAGGWAHLLDDFGSGYYLGLQSMIAAVRAIDGRGAPTALTKSLLAALELHDIQDIMRRLYHDGMGRAEVAALAPLVIHAAANGDAVARQIIERGVDELALMVETVARKLEFLPGQVLVGVTGGVAHSGSTYKEPLYAAIRRRVPTAEIVEPRLPPVLGAALLALESLGVQPSTELINQLQQEWQRQ
jgi:N-acetylglucosamine kinase-like BadF-type ATPase